MQVALAVDVAIKVVVIGLSLYPLVRPESSHFAGKAMGFRAVVYPVIMFLIPVTWLVAGQPSPYPFLADIALAIPFLLDAAGNVFGWFDIKRFDVIPHVLGWFFLTIAFGLAVAPLVPEPWIAFGLVFGFGAVVDIVWEIGEFGMMRLGSSGLALTYENTIQDLAMSLTGSFVGALVVATVLWPPAGTPATLFGWT